MLLFSAAGEKRLGQCMTAGLFRGRRDRDTAGRIIPRRLGETRYDWQHYMPFQAKRAPSTRVAVAQNMHMSRDYLQQIEHAAFPLQVEEPSAIGCIYVLRAAGMVEAAVTPSGEPGKVTSWLSCTGSRSRGVTKLERMRRGERAS